MLLRLAALLAVGSAWCTFGTDVAVGTAAPRTRAHDDRFTTAEECAQCHLGAPGANAMRTATGDDVSPYALWQGTMMANAFRDPYFRAQLQKESAAAGEQVQELCLRCHAPMASHGAVLGGEPAPRLAAAADDVFADDGVSCTVCHLIDGKNLGQPESFSGRPTFDAQRRIYGPFADVATRPMQNLVRYTPTQGLHVRQSALCGSCHTLFTEHHGTPFPEQTPYLEWRNSVFNDEGGVDEETRTCQQCHMAVTTPTRIARSPMGVDFDIPARAGYSSHAFVGGNAFMLDLLRTHREELGVTAETDALVRMAAATRRQLADATASLTISPLARADGHATFTIRVDNHTGHKFPTGYPARRAWLQVEVFLGGRQIFASGAFDADGKLVGVADEHRLAHVQTVTQPGEVVVYELVADAADGAPTTFLTKMAQKRKDNRLLPRGYRPDGPHVADTAPVGTDGDADFVGGSDTVAFRIPLPEGRGRLQVQATLHYQPVPPLWVDALRGVVAPEAQRFVAMYDAADKAPETVARASRSEAR
jgi:hypothetical protein